MNENLCGLIEDLTRKQLRKLLRWLAEHDLVVMRVTVQEWRQRQFEELVKQTKQFAKDGESSILIKD